MAVEFKFNLVDESNVEMEVGGIKEVLVASDLEKLQEALAEIRARMSPPVANDPNLLEPVTTVVNPRWFVAADMGGQGVILQIRDQGRGWLAYLIPAEWSQKMAELIATNTPTDQPPPPGSLN
ncbi:MAG: hypothetical protein ACN6PJ_27595 [Achromobacter sp.]|uniref:hypothetical protein n=1 Tax=Achromobacter sp. TaxID=134375 RepID=UPI003D03ADEB